MNFDVNKNHLFHGILVDNFIYFLFTIVSLDTSGYSYDDDDDEVAVTIRSRKGTVGNDNLVQWADRLDASSPTRPNKLPLEQLALNEDVVSVIEEGGKFGSVWEVMKPLGWMWVKVENSLSLSYYDNFKIQSPCGAGKFTENEIMDFLVTRIPIKNWHEDVSSSEEEEEVKEEVVVEEIENEEKEEEFSCNSEEEEEEESQSSSNSSSSSSSTMSPQMIEEEEEEEKGEVEEVDVKFNDLWQELKLLGWGWDYGDGLISVVYLKPDVSKKDGVLGVDMFSSEEEVLNHIKTKVPYLVEKFSKKSQESVPSSARSSPSSLMGKSSTKLGSRKSSTKKLARVDQKNKKKRRRGMELDEEEVGEDDDLRRVSLVGRSNHTSSSALKATVNASRRRAKPSKSRGSKKQRTSSYVLDEEEDEVKEEDLVVFFFLNISFCEIYHFIVFTSDEWVDK